MNTVFTLKELQRMDLNNLKVHDEEAWEYWKAIRKIVEYKELTEDKPQGQKVRGYTRT